MANKFLGSTSGLSIISDAGQADITSDYNTGVMPLPSGGDIKLAALCDAEGTTDSVVGATVEDSQFTGTGVLDGFTLEGTATNNNGVNILDITSGGGTNLIATKVVPLIVGETYTVTKGTTSGLRVISNPAFDFVYVNGVETRTFTATLASIEIALFTGGALYQGTLDFITIKLATPDRSVNGNGLQVFGTLTKSPVATGADLQAWSGFTAYANRLELPAGVFDANGTVFYMMGWLKTSGIAAKIVIGTGDTGVTRGYRSILIEYETGYVSFAGWANEITSTKSVTDGVWHHLVMIVDDVNSKATGYVDGALIINNQSPPSTLLPFTNTRWVLGGDFADAFSTKGSLALWRIGAGAPTAEQIREIYLAEKPMFRAGAKCTLQGGDAVSSMDFNRYKNLLYVDDGTYVNKFQGLVNVGTLSSGASNIVASESDYEVIS